MIRKTNIILFLVLCVAFRANAQLRHDIGMNEVMARSTPVIEPRRGYPEPLPYVETECELISMHIPAIENPPAPLEKMPKLNEVDLSWGHTKEGDIVYNITKWFPLDEMRNKYKKEDERWVYYNQTSGYIIANADQFLKSSVYDYVKGKLLKQGVTFRFSMVYLEIDERVPLDLEAIQKAEYKTLIKYSGVCRSGDKVELNYAGRYLSVKTYMERYDANYVDMCLWLGDELRVRNSFIIRINEWNIYETVSSGSDKIQAMMVKVDCRNWQGQLVHFPVEKDKFVRVPEYQVAPNPFEQVNSAKYHKGYEVPPDIIRLLLPHESNGDPFGVEIPEKYRGDSVDISDLLLKQGVNTIGIFDRPSSMLVVYGTEDHHSSIEELFAVLGPHSLLSYMVGVNFYEVDSGSISEKHVWSIENLLARNPIKLASVGSMTLSGERASVSDGCNYCEIELIRNEYGWGVDLGLDLKLDLPKLKLIKDFDLEVKYNAQKIIKVASGEKGRAVVMMVNVKKTFDSREE